MSGCLEYNSDIFGGEERESEAYLYTAEGKFDERLPSISNIVPGANEYKGFRQDVAATSANYAFSSNEAKESSANSHPGVASPWTARRPASAPLTTTTSRTARSN